MVDVVRLHATIVNLPVRGDWSANKNTMGMLLICYKSFNEGSFYFVGSLGNQVNKKLLARIYKNILALIDNTFRKTLK
jgi:hypothetical protein